MYEIVDTSDAMEALIDIIACQTGASLFIDLEGVNLCRIGSISIIQVLVRPVKTTYLIDIYTLQASAFQVPGPQSDMTFKNILEDPKIVKVFFDVRNDSDALFAHFGINLDGVLDLQLMDLATRYSMRISGLAKCIESLSLSPAQKNESQEIKAQGLALFLPEKGGSYQIFNARPMAKAIILYCILDVRYMPQLYDSYKSRLSSAALSKVQRFSRERVIESQQASYNGKASGDVRTLRPANW